MITKIESCINKQTNSKNGQMMIPNLLITNHTHKQQNFLADDLDKFMYVGKCELFFVEMDQLKRFRQDVSLMCQTNSFFKKMVEMGMI